MSEKMVEITEERLKELEKRDEKLSALESGGVDNWEWYEDSLEEFWKKYEE